MRYDVSIKQLGVAKTVEAAFGPAERVAAEVLRSVINTTLPRKPVDIVVTERPNGDVGKVTMLVGAVDLVETWGTDENGMFDETIPLWHLDITITHKRSEPTLTAEEKADEARVNAALAKTQGGDQFDRPRRTHNYGTRR